MVYLTPAGGSSVSCDPISLLRGAEHRDLAVKFIEFVLSEDGQKLWCYKPGEPASAGGPEKFALRRLPIRRDFYPSTNPTIQKRHEVHLKHAADDLADPSVDPYTLAQAFVYYPRWTASHFGFHRDLIRVMCLDAGDELKAAWKAINQTSDPRRRAAALAQLGQLPAVPLTSKATHAREPVEITWRTAPDIGKKYDKLEYTREWTIFFRESYNKARATVP
jgi:hypothetical protein